nr:copper-exporting ATPase [Cryptomonas paramecium]
MILHKIYNFLNKRLNKNFLLTEKNNLKRKFIINCILKYYKHQINCTIDSNLKLKCIKFIFNKKKNVKISFIIEKIIGLSKFSRNKTVVIFYQICNINKTRQTHLLKEINKVKKNFFFIFTSCDMKKISSAIKKNVLVFYSDGLNFSLKKNKDHALKFKCAVKKNIKITYQYTRFLVFNIPWKNFVLYNRQLNFFLVRRFIYLDIFEVFKAIKLIISVVKSNISINFQILFVKNSFCFIWNRLKNLILKFYYRTN